MTLPEAVLACIHRLESRGFACYAVGGCVRDACLGKTPKDYDLCTAARPEQIKEVFRDENLVLAGEKHGTVGVVTAGGVVEITTFRTDGSYRDSRHPDWVEFVEDINSDLARRDFTVNAIAWSPRQGFADPFGGRQDLKDRILRAVGNPETRFREDALRILRGARFSVTYGLTPEEHTLETMKALAPTMEKLARERVFEELCKLIIQATAKDLLQFKDILAQVLPELGKTFDFLQHSPHHAYDVFTHTAHVTEAAPEDLAVRWAALLHDIGKVPAFSLDENKRGHFYGHAQFSAQMAEEILLRLKAPTALRQQVVFLIEHHMLPLTPEKKQIKKLLSRFGEDNLRKLIALQKADFLGKGVAGDWVDFDAIYPVLEEVLRENACLSIKDLAVDGHDLMALGLVGPQIGSALEHLLALVLEESVPNEKTALLKAARKEDL